MRRFEVADPWFVRSRVDDTVTLLTEPYVHPLLRCNIWHVRGTECDVLIDTGLGVSSLAAATGDLLGTEVLAVATHAHTDHVGNFHEFDHRAIHACEAATVAAIDGTLMLDVSGTDEAVFRSLAAWGYDIRGGLLTALPAEGFALDGHPRRAAAPTRILHDGDVIELGDRTFEVLHVPGHSPGSIALWDPAASILFSGDAVYDGPLLDEIQGADVDLYVESMHRLRQLPVDVVHGGHGPSMDRRRLHEVIDAYLDGKSA